MLVSNTTGTYLGLHEVERIKAAEGTKEWEDVMGKGWWRGEKPALEAKGAWGLLEGASRCANVHAMGKFRFDKEAHAEQLSELRAVLQPYGEMMESFIPGIKM